MIPSTPIIEKILNEQFIMELSTLKQIKSASKSVDKEFAGQAVQNFKRTFLSDLSKISCYKYQVIFRFLCMRDYFEVRGRKLVNNQAVDKTDENDDYEKNVYRREITKLIDMLRLMSDADGNEGFDEGLIDKIIEGLVISSKSMKFLNIVLKMLKQLEISEPSQKLLIDNIRDLKCKITERKQTTSDSKLKTVCNPQAGKSIEKIYPEKSYTSKALELPKSLNISRHSSENIYSRLNTSTKEEEEKSESDFVLNPIRTNFSLDAYIQNIKKEDSVISGHSHEYGTSNSNSHHILNTSNSSPFSYIKSASLLRDNKKPKYPTTNNFDPLEINQRKVSVESNSRVNNGDDSINIHSLQKKESHNRSSYRSLYPVMNKANTIVVKDKERKSHQFQQQSSKKSTTPYGASSVPCFNKMASFTSNISSNRDSNYSNTLPQLEKAISQPGFHHQMSNLSNFQLGDGSRSEKLPSFFDWSSNDVLVQNTPIKEVISESSQSYVGSGSNSRKLLDFKDAL